MQVSTPQDSNPAGREEVALEALRLPVSGLPRLGDSVVWYLNAARQEGQLFGHASGSRPVVKTQTGYTFPLSNFDEVRWKDPADRTGPVWNTLPDHGKIFKPNHSENSEFIRLLSQPIPPGPSYYELIEEIWMRGFEVFVVGGTVRDVISGHKTNDVDLVTTMPLERAAPLLASMYRRTPQIYGRNGYVRLGGTPASGDPFIDLKSFVYSDPGTEQAVFGGDFRADVKHRDFACNSVYYDPINNVLIDPTGRGVAEAEAAQLSVVCDSGRPAFHKGQIVIRFIKFRCRGFTALEETIDAVRSLFVPSLKAMRRSDLINYLYKQVFGKTAIEDRQATVVALEGVVCEVCGHDAWNDVFAPVLEFIPSEETA